MQEIPSNVVATMEYIRLKPREEKECTYTDRAGEEKCWIQEKIGTEGQDAEQKATTTMAAKFYSSFGNKVRAAGQCIT